MAIAIVASLPPVVVGQAPMTLGEALRRADQHAFPNRIAAAEATAARARASAADQGVLPAVRAELGAVRTTDPLAGFGFVLRQRAVTPEAFAPDGLNRPPARTDVGAAVVGEVPLVNLDAWAGRAAARHAAVAALHARDWDATGVRLDAMAAYYGAILAGERAAVLRAAEVAGMAHVRRAESALRNGMVTRSDLLLAEVRVGEITTQRLGAEADAVLARQALALTLGTPGDTAFTLPGTIPVLDSAPVPAGGGVRADVRMASAGAEAAEADARRRALALLPRLNGFARQEWHDGRTPFGGESMWTIGVMASWAPFSGGAELAARREASARAAMARAGAEAVAARAELERASAASAVAVARQAVTIAARGAMQAGEAHRIVERKYEGGLATIAELLEAQATELAARLAEAKARHDLIVAQGTLARATGADLATLASALDAATIPE